MQLIQLLGHIGSLDDLWRAFPDGGLEGDYVYIGPSYTCYAWNVRTRRWVVTDGPQIPDNVAIPEIAVPPEIFEEDSSADVVLNDVGTFDTMDALWVTYPEGGHNGDYATVGGVVYYWSSADRNWIVKADGPDIIDPSKPTLPQDRTKINYLGTFASVDDIWYFYPEGGYKGDYALVLGDLYTWDPATFKWKYTTEVIPLNPTYLSPGDTTGRREIINFLGDFDLILDVWKMYPEGGFEGDYVHVGGEIKVWNKYARDWGVETDPETPAVHGETYDGSLTIMHDLIVAGHIYGIASDSILWDRHAWADYMDQAVRTTDDVRFHSVTASRFAVPNGTGSQFMKADGSLDNNDYVTEQELDHELLIYGTNIVIEDDGSLCLYHGATPISRITHADLLRAANSGVANRLATKRYFWGNEFDGTADVTGDIKLNNKRILFNNGVADGTHGIPLIEYDTANHAIKINGNVYATGFVSASGLGPGGSTGGGGTNVIWSQIQTDGTKIATIKIGDDAPIDVFAPTGGGGGANVSWDGDYSPRSVGLKVDNKRYYLSLETHSHTLYVEKEKVGDYALTPTNYGDTLDGVYADKVHSHQWDDFIGRPTTLEGFGITDGVTKTTFDACKDDVDTLKGYFTGSKAKNADMLDGKHADYFSPSSHNHHMQDIDDADDWVNGFNFLTANQTIELSGDLTGSGRTFIDATIKDEAVTNAKIQNPFISISGVRVNLGNNLAMKASYIDDLTTWLDDNGYLSQISLTGDITGSGGSTIATTIANGAVTNEKINKPYITISGKQIDLGASVDITELISDLFEKVSDGKGGYAIRANYSFYSVGQISAGGIGESGGGGGGDLSAIVMNGKTFTSIEGVVNLGTVLTPENYAQYISGFALVNHTHSEYALKSHTHTTSQITDIESWLAGKKLLDENSILDKMVRGMRAYSKLSNPDDGFWRIGDNDNFGNLRLFGQIPRSAFGDNPLGLTGDANAILAVTTRENTSTMSAYQILFGSNGNMFVRNGRSSSGSPFANVDWKEIWDSGNSNKTDVDWTCKDLHAKRWFPIADDPDHYIEYDVQHMAFKVAGNFYATGQISAGGIGSNGSDGAMDISALEFNVLPKANNTLSVGSYAKRFRNGYFTNIDVNGAVHAMDMVFGDEYEEDVTPRIVFDDGEFRIETGEDQLYIAGNMSVASDLSIDGSLKVRVGTDYLDVATKKDLESIGQSGKVETTAFTSSFTMADDDKHDVYFDKTTSVGASMTLPLHPVTGRHFRLYATNKNLTIYLNMGRSAEFYFGINDVATKTGSFNVKYLTGDISTRTMLDFVYDGAKWIVTGNGIS